MCSVSVIQCNVMCDVSAIQCNVMCSVSVTQCSVSVVSHPIGRLNGGGLPCGRWEGPIQKAFICCYQYFAGEDKALRTPQ